MFLKYIRVLPPRKNGFPLHAFHSKICPYCTGKCEPFIWKENRSWVNYMGLLRHHLAIYLLNKSKSERFVHIFIEVKLYYLHIY